MQGCVHLLFEKALAIITSSSMRQLNVHTKSSQSKISVNSIFMLAS